ncbi:DUF885 domain-containing protein [Henriciella barbarensis]|nr:DUF885 domain-containing protein [Henriciella barbarensis]
MNLRSLATALLLSVASPALVYAQSNAPEEREAPTIEQIVIDYEALIRSLDPSEAARAQDRAPDRWADVSPERIEQTANEARALLARLQDVEDQSTPEWKILSHLLESHIAEAKFDTARLPFNGDWGFQAEPLYAARQVRIANEDDAEAWLSRLNAIPRYFNDHKTNMRRGIETGWTSHKDPLATTTAQIREQANVSPEESGLYAPLKNLPDTISPEAQDMIQASGRRAVAKAIEAYAEALYFMESVYAPAARADAGIANLNDGKAYYAAVIAYHTAGAGYSPEEIHQLGEREVARIRGEMETIIEELGYPGSFEDFQNFLRTDPQFYAQTPEDLLEKASRLSKRLDAILPAYFGKLPRLTYGVIPVPAEIAPGYTTGRYSSGDLEKGIEGNYLVNTYALDQRPLYELPALSAHEAVPGHHLQISLSQELEDVPRFRQQYYATAFGEGWGLYAEKLAGEAGIYETPYERFGALSMEMWRACRLVADTGLHWYGWSREEAEECFTNNSALAPLNIQTEVTRYIGWPGQATAYKIGELKILELRAAAKDALGTDFDIRDFHDVVLGAGALPLDALEARVTEWIESETEASPATEAE